MASLMGKHLRYQRKHDGIVRLDDDRIQEFRQTPATEASQQNVHAELDLFSNPSDIGAIVLEP